MTELAKRYEEEKNVKKNQIVIHQTFESGPLLTFKPEYRRLWEKSYIAAGSHIGKPRLIIGTSNNLYQQS